LLVFYFNLYSNHSLLCKIDSFDKTRFFSSSFVVKYRIFILLPELKTIRMVDIEINA